MAKQQLSALEQLQHREADNKTAFREMKQAEEARYFSIRDQAALDVGGSPANYIKYLDVQAALYLMGTSNLLAVAAQYPETPTALKTKKEWRDLGRSVRDESPILIRQKDPKSGYNNVIHVYDLQQTEGRYFPLKSVTLDERSVVESNQSLLKTSRVPVVAVNSLETPALFDPQNNLILVRANLTHTEIFRYLPHEIALSQLPREGYDREAYHLEAASISYVVHKRFGAQGLFEEYGKKTKQEDFAKLPEFALVRQVYEGCSKDEIISSLSFIRDQAATICGAVERAISPLARQDFSRIPTRPGQTPAKAQPER